MKNHIIRRSTTLGIVIILFGAQALAQTAGSKLSEWENLRSIASTQKVRILGGILGTKMAGKKKEVLVYEAP